MASRPPCRGWPWFFAGYDVRRNAARFLFQYDVTGGRYEESDFAATASGTHASTVIKLGYEEDQGRDAAIDLAITAIFQAADEDSATGGPDLVQGIFPTIATITSAGFGRVAEDEVGDRFRGLVERLSLPHGDIEAPPGGGVPGGERR